MKAGPRYVDGRMFFRVRESSVACPRCGRKPWRDGGPLPFSCRNGYCQLCAVCGHQRGVHPCGAGCAECACALFVAAEYAK